VSDAVRLLARAKLTLTLRVLGVRPDGFHDLEALVASVGDPSDVVTVRPGSGPRGRVSVTGPAGAGVPADASNLAQRAAAELSGWPFDVDLAKTIPAGAGLGGGSADAAAVLVAVDRLAGLGLGPAGLRDIAARLGSDMPFCLEGGLAWMRGRGEVIEPLGPLPDLPLVIAVPPFALATPAVYRAWDDLGGPRSDRVCPPPTPEIAALVPDGLVNDLEPAAEAVEPRLRPFRQALEDACGLPAVLAGSGSAYFIPVPAGTGTGTAAAEAARTTGATAWATHPVQYGVERAS
jgi:4-diphosphocytidyl-2-C-methyl-D-erythritol kinase